MVLMSGAHHETDDPELVDIDIEPYVKPHGLTTEQQIEHRLEYEFNARLTKDENERRRKEREKRIKSPDEAFEFKLALIRQRFADGVFPDKLVDEAISEALCDPNSYTRKYALSKYAFKGADLQTFAQDHQSLSYLVKIN
jgi:hypothetical protein